MKAQNVYLEHANITVNNLDNATHFFQTAFPDFKIRGGGTNEGRKWIHLGNEATYLALNESNETISSEKGYAKNGFNHIGFVVEDVESLAIRLLEAGFKRDYPKQIEKFRTRDYFADADGNEYEFIQYLSDSIEERNSFDS
jgi:hypothetical protein